MAPDLRDSTTTTYSYRYHWLIYSHGPYKVYYNSSKSYEPYEYDNTTSPKTYWSHHDKYDTSFTEILIYPTKQIEKNVKKLLKKMANEMCKEGWIKHMPYYLEPNIIPINLRGIRLQGWGWGNKNT